MRDKDLLKLYIYLTIGWLVLAYLVVTQGCGHTAGDGYDKWLNTFNKIGEVNEI